MTFKVGDTVVYPSQGAGVIEELTTREVLGESHEYLRISFLRDDMEVFVPVKKGVEVGLRHTIGKDELQSINDAMVKADIALPNQWPPRYRAEQDILTRGNAYELARLVGALTQRDVEKGLAATEREVLEKAKNLLLSELAVVQDQSYEDAKAQVEEILSNLVEA